MKENPDGAGDFQILWNYALDQGTVIGCYKLDAQGKIGKLVGANIVYMVTEDTMQDLAYLKV